ncbi:MAG: GH36-type glycosyl hydrolase domain-containing protein [Thermoanaerobaculia bacterium]
MSEEHKRASLGEFLPVDRLEEHARAFGARWTVVPRGGGRHVLRRLRANLPALRRGYRVFASDVRAGESATPAVEWLLDNFHLIEAEVRGVRHDLPRAYNRKLPRLAGPEHGGAARVEVLARELVLKSDARLDAARLETFLAAFQTTTPLTLAEIWAWPSFLRAALIEHLRLLADELLAIRADRLRADRELAQLSSGKRAVVPDPAPTAFAARLVQRAREFGAPAADLVSDMSRRLAERGRTLEDAVRAEHQRQAAMQVSIANAVSTLRLCGTLDWGPFVERVSLVEEALRHDPNGTYGRMDFATRDRYRHAVEKLAASSAEEQLRVARRAVARAREAPADADPREAHVGWFLVGPGRQELEREVGRRRGLAAVLRRGFFRHATAAYLGAIAVLTAGGLAAVAAYVRSAGAEPRAEMWAFALAALPVSEIAVFLVQRLVDVLIPPRRLPRLDFRSGVPASARTLVVFPTLFPSVASVEPMLRHLEVQALANPDANVHFALLSDFLDALEPTRPDDDAILAAASGGIAALNAAHGTDRFFLFHRVRRWNPNEGLWMGWERKRGKLEELNRLLRGATDTTFGLQVGNLSILPSVRYVLTLDSDTRLPRDAARALVGILEHPLNRPRLGPASRRVVAGYGILQPRIAIATTSATASRFARMFSGHTGVDPYSTAVSDTYQDLFGEGVFTGKGLYDVDAFQASLEGRVPENSLLSHDLFEGLHARTALVTDVELVDDYPGNVLAHARRQHRWVRGDWQILRWLLPIVPTRAGLERNRLPLIAQWKILDNLRRSLLPPALLALLVAGLTVLPGRPSVWVLLAFAVLALPLVSVGRLLLEGPRPQQPASGFLREFGRDLETALAQALVGLAFLPHYAFEAVHAIALTLIRVVVTGRRLLEWETAATAAARAGGLLSGGPGSFFLEMAAGPLAAVLLDIVVAAARPSALPLAVPFFVLWGGSPFLAWWLSHASPPGARALSEPDRELFLRTARETWRFFEEMVRDDSNGLVPDNAAIRAEGGATVVAPRTSPTNVGLSLLADLAAHDFGWLDGEGLLARVGKTLGAVESLERWRGHVLNWHDTRSLEPLEPRYVSTVDSGNLAACLLVLAQGLKELATEASDPRAEDLARRALALADGMDFGALYDASRGLFVTGCRPMTRESAVRDETFYDLLASEACVASFIAIAKGDVPQSHWFRLGRLAVSVHGVPTLLSWSGSMFEYLMPLLFTRTYPGTLLGESSRMVVRRQREWGRANGVPWGFSESAYRAVDLAGEHQYRAFGTPGLGFRRGLDEELVVAPYATALAALLAPAEAAKNLQRLAAAGAHGPWGFWDAVDYTAVPADLDSPSLPRTTDGRGMVIRTAFAHHQGMSLVALANVLLGHVMVRRFHADPRVNATELLLQERPPREASVAQARPSSDEAIPLPASPAAAPRLYGSPHAAFPATQFLSNGTFVTSITQAGGGSSSWRGLSVVRRRADPTVDPAGHALYLRDVRSGAVWSAGFAPTLRDPESYRVTFLPEAASIRRRDAEIDSLLEVAVSPEEDVDVRRLTLTNLGASAREIEVTSAVEVVLAKPEDDVAHPVFAKLFLETEAIPENAALLCARRPRAAGETPLYAVHVLAVAGRRQGSLEWETDRARFLGRGRDASDPVALDGRALSGKTGTVLDPILSLRQRIRLAPGSIARLVFTTGVTGSREAALALVQKHHDPSAAVRAFALARTHAQVAVRHLGLSPEETRLFEQLASCVLGSDRSLSAPPGVQAANVLDASALWRHGISGDLPILTVRLGRAADLALARQTLEAQEYWRLKGLASDLVLLNEHPEGYRKELHDLLRELVERGPWAPHSGKKGGVFLLRGDLLGPDEQRGLLAHARAVLSGEGGGLALQLDRTDLWAAEPPPPPVLWPAQEIASQEPLPRLEMANGFGGFGEGGRTYEIALEGERETPHPWSNVLANPSFGSLVTTSGAAMTWSSSSRENRLTPFANDPVSDPVSEAVFIRDDETGEVVGATPGARSRDGTGSWRVTHEPGLSSFRRTSNGIARTLETFVAHEEPVKISLLTLENLSGRSRRLAVFAVADWVLGSPRVEAPRHVVTSLGTDGRVLLARNPENAAFAGRVAFLAASEPLVSWTGDRREFHGAGRTLRNATGPHRARLSGKTGGGLDPCAAVHVAVPLAPGETRTLAFVLGEGRDEADALRLAERFAELGTAEAERGRVRAAWEKTLGALVVKTPDDSLDLLVNRWLPYQVIASRLWGKTGYHQPGGAWGFRDQLQDVSALVLIRPDLAREHLVRAAGRQFREGDVQHWWLEPSGRGTRTRCSDDLLWLPWTALRYAAITGDATVWDERTSYLEGAPLAESEREAYFEPVVSAESDTLFGHAARAIDASLTAGSQGLPLMGTGDWNDGMNEVGPQGRGESVWLGFFLHSILVPFAALCEARADGARAARYRQEAGRLQHALGLAWDGDWYRRATFDDGTPLGSRRNVDGQLDSIAQTWAVLSGAAPRAQAERALDAVLARLVRRDAEIVALLAPPFDRGPEAPGYIKGYPPGIRENGAQYTQAAAWVVIAAAALESADEALEIFHMLNPVNHTRTEGAVRRYQGEPYVVAGDVSANPAHLGEAGWTWYTGSAGWLYRAAIESLLGLRREGEVLRIAPCVPSSWPGYSVSLRIGRTLWEIRIENPNGRTGGLAELTVDGELVPGNGVPLVNDGACHRVRGVLGAAPALAAARPPATLPARRRAPEPPPTGMQPDVLVVDDDGALRDGILSLLDDEGLSCVGAEDGAEALERLEAGLMPRLVLVDLEMPRMNGWAFVRRLEDQPAFSALPIIVMSGIAAPGFAPPRKNDAGFLRKPFDPAELVRVTRRWLAEA